MTNPTGTHYGKNRHLSIRPPRLDRDNETKYACENLEVREAFFAPDPTDPNTVSEQGRSPERKRREHVARQVCATCPFVVECALHGLEHEDYGVWGGLSERDRYALGGRAGDMSGKGTHNTLQQVIRSLSEAGFSLHTAKTILLRWRARQAERKAA